MYSIGLDTDSRGMGIAFVPFTFPTFFFRNLALEAGYPSLTFGVIDEIWSVYRDGRKSGALPVGGYGNASRNYLVSKGIDSDLAWRWLTVADEAATRPGGQGTWFVDFGGKPGVAGAASGVIQAAVEGVSEVVRAGFDVVGDGVSKALGLPKWIFWAIVALIVLIVAYFFVMPYLPRALRRA